MNRVERLRPQWRWALLLALVVVCSRLVAGWFLNTWNVVNDSGVALKPWGPPAHLDFAVYKTHAATAWDGLGKPWVWLNTWWAQDWESAWAWLKVQPLKPGPVYPALLQALDYANHQAAMASLYMVLGAALGWGWAWWARAQGASVAVQLLLAGFPALVYYAFVVSTDLLFAICTAGIYVTLWQAVRGSGQALWWCMVMLLLAVLTRPVALSLVPLVWWAIAVQPGMKWPVRAAVMAAWGLVAIYMGVYYLPYFWVHETNGLGTHYWGVYPHEYRQGLFDQLPDVLNLPLSWLLLAGAKLLHSVGLRPSYADLGLGLTMARALPGLLFLPGLVYGLFYGKRFDRIFLLFFLPPVYVAAAQERYLLPITPLLVVWGVQAWREVLERLLPRDGKGSASSRS
jgi:hypothetical protein